MKKSRLLGVLCIALFCLYPTLSNAVLLSLEGRLETAPGSGVFLAYYDPNLNITWATDSDINGVMSWSVASAWVSSLTIGGVSGWRLPSMDANLNGTVVDCTGGGVIGCNDNELGFLYWEEGITTSTSGPFDHVQAQTYWSSTEFNSTSVYSLVSFGHGLWGAADKDSSFRAWAVHSGDVPALASVPVPAAYWLFSSGLWALIGISRQKKVA